MYPFDAPRKYVARISVPRNGTRMGGTVKRIFVINPVAGSKNSVETLCPRILSAAARTDSEIEMIVTAYPGHARELAEKFARDDTPIWLYACGGDGTFNEMVQAAAGHPAVSIGIVPCGSGNDFVRNFGGKTAFLDIAAQLAARPYTIDTIHTEYGYSAAICAAGLDAQVAYGIPKFKRLPLCGGSMAYTLSIVEAFFSKLSHHLRVTLDDECLEGNFMMSAICNDREYGDGYKAGPHALLDDGLLDVVLLKPVPRLKMPGLLARYKVGGHLSATNAVTQEFQPYMSCRRVRSVAMQVLDSRPMIVTLDGECAPRRELHADICEKSLSILLPAGISDGVLPFVQH